MFVLALLCIVLLPIAIGYAFADKHYLPPKHLQ
jgi:hypothetical protein